MITDKDMDKEAEGTPHMSAAVHAYYVGKADCKASFSRPELRKAYEQGKRDLAAENRLNEDGEWDD